jgi:MarR family transcriptional regulator, temperature-dependent positive regulator of motility
MTALHRQTMLARGTATIGFRLSYLANFYTEPVYREVTRRHGIARSEFVVLLCLRQLGTMTAQDICDVTGRPKNSISQAVAKLDKAGHIVRSADEGDARRSHLDLTESGRGLCDAIVPLFYAREADMLAVLTDKQRKQLEELLELLTQRSDGWATSDPA